MQPERHRSCSLDVKPLQLIDGSWPSDSSIKKLDQLYETAALVPWVLQFATTLDDPKCRSQTLDLTEVSTGLQHKGWTEGLLLHVRQPVLNWRAFRCSRLSGTERFVSTFKTVRARIYECPGTLPTFESFKSR